MDLMLLRALISCFSRNPSFGVCVMFPDIQAMRFGEGYNRKGGLLHTPYQGSMILVCVTGDGDVDHL